jgi:hypothetical protein
MKSGEVQREFRTGRQLAQESVKVGFVALMASLGCSISIAQTAVTIPGTANIYGAGHATPPQPGGGGAGVLPTLVNLPVGTHYISFSGVTGTVSYESGTSCGAEGSPQPLPGTDINSCGGISGIIHSNRGLFLSGVFLDNSEPSDPAPVRLVFDDTRIGFTFISPLLRQTFFIGDGLTGTGSGSQQLFVVPTGATRLYLGFHDGRGFTRDPGYYDDNGGQLSGTVNIFNWGQPALSNVRASQRAGTSLVDVWYDLSGASAPVVLSASISTDGGVSYALQPTHLTGDGVTTPVGSGTSRHLVWDAGADWPGRYSTQMRVLVSVPQSGGSAQANSQMFTLDTRSVLTGAIAGAVTGNGVPLVGAQVRVEGTAFVASSVANGAFTLAGVPVASGYVVTVSADGYGSQIKSRVDVTTGTANLGTISLASAGRPYHIIPLVPDVNPALAQVEGGGTNYRYYQVVAADGRTPVVSANVTLRISGGSTISQAGDVSDVWAGRTAGIPDADGILRLRIPASSLGSFNTPVTLQVLESGVVQQTFQAQVIPRSYDQVWKHKVGGGVSGKIAAVRVGGSGAYETQVRQTMVNGSPTSEQITRIRSGEVRAGLDVGGGLKLVAGGEVDLGVGAYAGAELSSTYHFSPGSTGQEENAMKIYVALGDDLSLALGPARALYDFVRAAYEPQYLDSNLDSADGELRLGGYVEADADFGLGPTLGKQAQLGIGAHLSGQVEGIYGYGESYGTNSESYQSLGLGISASANAGAGISIGSGGDKDQLQLSLFGVGGEAELLGRVVTGYRTSALKRLEIEQRVALDAGLAFVVPGWSSYDNPLLQGQYHREFTETVTYIPPGPGAFAQLSQQAPIWNAIAGSGQGSVVQSSLPGLILNSVSQYALNNGSSLGYERSVYAAV